MFAPADQYVPQSVSQRGPWVAWLVLVLGALVVVGLIVGAPLALADNHTSIAFVIYRGFSKVCHQIPERSFYLAGFPLAVCSRCTGLYAGFSAALIAYPLFRSLRATDAPHPRWLFLAAMPLGVDFSLTFLGLWENTHSSRLLTGALLGAVAVFYVMPGVADLVLRWQRRSIPTPITLPPITTTTQPIAAVPSDYSAPHRRI